MRRRGFEPDLPRRGGGVETADDLRRMEALGCDVIQGYCFAKPMKYVDYFEFVEKNFESAEHANTL